jgi:hypothetical protein
MSRAKYCWKGQEICAMKGMFCLLPSAHLFDGLTKFIDRQDVEDKKTIISLFLARFTLTEAEVEALTSRDVPIGQTVFRSDGQDRTDKRGLSRSYVG